MSLKQLFFRKDELDQALEAAKDHNEELFEIIDGRSKNPTPRMYVLTQAALLQMVRAKMLKRMWIQHQIAWKEPKDAEQKEG